MLVKFGKVGVFLVPGSYFGHFVREAIVLFAQAVDIYENARTSDLSISPAKFQNAGNQY